MSGYDLFDGEAGLFASAHEGGAAVLLNRDRIDAAPTEETSRADGNTLFIDIGDHQLAADVTPSEPGLSIEGELVGAAEVRLCSAAGSLAQPDGETAVACPAISTVTTRPEIDDLALTRSITIVLGDGSLLALRAARPAGAGEQEGEEVVAAISRPEKSIRIEEPLLSTEFDADGHHRRATLELWATDDSDQSLLRGAGSRVASASVESGGRRRVVALFTWSVDGMPGLGRYEITRAI